MQFVRKVCGEIRGDIKKGAYGISLIKVQFYIMWRGGHKWFVTLVVPPIKYILDISL